MTSELAIMALAMKSWSSLLAPAVWRRTALHVNPGKVKAVCATVIRKGSVTKGTLLRERS